MGRAVRSQHRGRRAQSLVMAETHEATLRALASVGTLPLLALLALSTLGGAQGVRRDSTGWARTPTIARALRDTVTRQQEVDSSTARRPASANVAVDTSAITASVEALPAAVKRTAGVSQYRSRRDSIASVRTRLAADLDRDLRIVISLNDRRLWALIGRDTLLDAPVAVSTDETLSYAGRTWTFETPRGIRRVVTKRENPVWIPPEWHYAETARELGLKLATMSGRKTPLSDGRWLEVRSNRVGVVDPITREFAELPVDEEIIFDGTLFIPPIGTDNRRIEGELGKHMLDTGNGFLLHGTPHKATIGTAATHGCIRLRDEDIEWLYDMVPVGTRVYIY